MPFHHGWLDEIVVAYTISTKAKLLFIMLNRSRFVYSVLHTLLGLFASTHSKTSFEKNCFSAWASTLNMGLINKVDMVCLSPVGYGV